VAPKKKPKREVTDIVPVMVRLREGLRQHLAKQAEKNVRSLNKEIEERLWNSLAIEDLASLKEQIALMRELQEKKDSEAQAELEITRLKLNAAEAKNAELQARLEQVRSSVSLLNILLGENRASREVLRDVAMLFANSPDWPTNVEAADGIISHVITLLKSKLPTPARRS
jgi:hypothetical protein